MTRLLNIFAKEIKNVAPLTSNLKEEKQRTLLSLCHETEVAEGRCYSAGGH